MELCLPKDGLFLNAREMEALSVCGKASDMKDHSILNGIFGPLLDLCLTRRISQSISSNVLSLAALTAALQTCLICSNSDRWRVSEQRDRVICIGIELFLGFRLLAQRPHIQARGDKAISELFGNACDAVALSGFSMISSQSLDFSKEQSRFIVEALLLLMVIQSLIGTAGRLMIGASELIILWFFVLLRPHGGFVEYVKSHFQLRVGLSSFLIICLSACVSVRSLNGTTRNSAAVLITMMIYGFRRFVQLAFGLSDTSEHAFISDCLFLSAIATDLQVARMVGRGIHPVFPILALVKLLPQSHWLTNTFVGFYFLRLFHDLTVSLQVPLFRTCRNVYCDGIYDLCHIGHKKLFRRASALGDRLFVGVVGDKDANAYKRPPIMSAQEREVEVLNCKCVSGVIKEAPCFGLTEEFLRDHQIHVVAFGQEYLEKYPNPDDDPYYKVPRKMGIAVPMPRSQEISTSELIQRILDRGNDSKKSPT